MTDIVRPVRFAHVPGLAPIALVPGPGRPVVAAQPVTPVPYRAPVTAVQAPLRAATRAAFGPLVSDALPTAAATGGFQIVQGSATSVGLVGGPGLIMSATPAPLYEAPIVDIEEFTIWTVDAGEVV